MKNKKIKKVYLSGGFGNIMFQFVLINKLKELGYTVVIYDIFLKNNIITKRVLKWNLQNDFYKLYFKKNKIPIESSSIVNSFYAIFLFYFSKLYNKSFFGHLFNSTNSEIHTNFHLNNSFMGYFQTKDFLEKNPSAFKITLESIRKIIIHHQIDSVVHYRGNDSGYSKDNLSYLKKAITGLHNFTIVTDNRDFIVDQLEGFNLSIVSNTPLLDFSILCGAQKNFICSNSTFSWWAAHLLKEDVKVTFPKNIFEQLGFYNVNIIKSIS